jgi:hypothetical protein
MIANGGSGVVIGGLVYGSTGGSFDRGIDFALGARSGGTSNAGGNGGSAVAVNSECHTYVVADKLKGEWQWPG